MAVFLLSAAAIRRVMIDAEGDDMLATTALGGAILGVALGTSAEGINMMGAIRAQDGELSEELAQSLFEIPQFFGSAGAALGFAVFSLAFAVVAWRSGRIVPRYAVVLIAIIGLVFAEPARVPAGGAGRVSHRARADLRGSAAASAARPGGYSHSIARPSAAIHDPWL